MLKIGQKIEIMVRSLSSVLNWVSMVSIIVLILVVTVDVIGAFLFSKPLTGSIDIIEVVMTVIVFFAMAHCTLMDRHVRVDLFLSKFSKRCQAGINVLAFSIGLIIFAIITWRIAVRAWEEMLDPPGTITATLLIPYFPFLCVAVVGCFVLCLTLLIKIIKNISAYRKAFQAL